MAVAIVIALLVLGSIAFHILSPWWQTPLASNWGSIDDALNITLYICAIAFVALNLFLAWTIWRHRHRAGNTAHYEPENAKLEKQLTAWTAFGIAAMLAPGLIAWHEYVTVPKDATVIEVLGQQWQWSFRYPGADGVLGAASIRLTTPDNPFGLNPRDPYARDDILVENTEMRLPINKPVKMVLRSRDVLHDFYVPHFRAKMDLVPGIVTYFWMTPTRIGAFEILCAELCGTGHHQMRGGVIVSNEKDYGAWLAEQPTYGQLLAETSPATIGPAATAPATSSATSVSEGI